MGDEADTTNVESSGTKDSSGVVNNEERREVGQRYDVMQYGGVRSNEGCGVHGRRGRGTFEDTENDAAEQSELRPYGSGG